MEIDIMKVIIICTAGFLGSVIDAIVGGGGLITIPVLLSIGMPTYSALGTNKLASTIGSAASANHFFKKGEINVDLIKRLVLFSLLGSIAGTLTVLIINPEFLRGFIIVLVIAIAGYTMLNRELGLKNNFKELTGKMTILGMIAAFIIGFYNGFFGPGTGSFLIFALIWIFGFDFKKATANSKILNLVGNFTSLMLFILNDEINYFYGLLMGIAMIFGAKIGASLAINKGSKFIKPMFVVVSLVIVSKLIIDYFG